MILRSTRTAATIVAGCLATLGAQAQSPFAKALPSDTIAFLSFPDITKSLEEMQQAPIAKMWHEEEVQDFVAYAMVMLEAKWEEAAEEGQAMYESGDMPFNPADLSKLQLHSLGFALTSLSLGEFEGDPFPMIGVVAHAELGESATIWRGIWPYRT